MRIPHVAAQYWKATASGDLLVGDISVSTIAARYGTPLFVYDRSVMARKLSALRHALPARFAISYSVKANPHPVFLKFFLSHGCGLEIASAGEFRQALTAGCPASKIVFAGPGKTEEELQAVISQGVGEIHVESLTEAGRIARIANGVGVRVPVAIRVNPSDEEQGGAMRMGGKSAPFGVDEEQLEPILRKISREAWLDFCGIHLFIGTQILDSELLLRQYRKGIEIARRVAEWAAVPIRTLDFGGGLGIPYFAGEAELDLDQLREGVSALFSSIENEKCFATTTFMLEPGRFLMGECGVYIARVTDIKLSRGKKYLILDGGMHHHLAASGNLGQVIKRNFPIAVVNGLNSPNTEIVDVVGPLCTPLDTLARSMELGTAHVGDLVGIFQSGAYARTASPLGFLSHPTPPEVLVDGDRDSLIRKRNGPVDFLDDSYEQAFGELASLTN